MLAHPPHARKAAMHITLRQLRAFIAVTQSGSFTQAAESLHLTQSALSGLIKELESHLGVRLFDRTTRQLSLSAMGGQIYPMASRIVHDVDAMLTEIGYLKDLHRGVVKITVSQQLAASLMPAVMAGFAAEHGDIRVGLEDCPVEKVLDSVRTGEVDFGLGPEREHSSDIQAERLFSLPFYLVLPAGHPLAAQAAVPWPALAGETLITLNGPFSDLLAAELGGEAGAAVSGAAHRVNLLSTAVSMVHAGLGLTLCLPFAANRIRQYGLQMRPMSQPAITRSFCLYRRKNRALSPAAERFHGFLCRSLHRYTAEWSAESAQNESICQGR